MLMVNQLVGFGVGGGSPIIITPLFNATDASDLTNYSWSGQNFGPASPDRKIVVAFMNRGSPGGAATASTIGGISASLVVAAQTDGTADNISIWIADVPTGTSGTVTLNTSASQFRASVAGFALTNVGSSTAFHTASGTSGDPLSVSLNVPAGGAAIGCYMNDGAAAGALCTWSGLTEYSDVTVETIGHSTGYGAFPSALTGLSVGVDYGGSVVGTALCAASWAPRV